MISLNLFIKLFILFNLIFLNLMSLFMHDLLMMWFIMEINNFLFISYMTMSLFNKKIIFFFYMIQILSSLIMIFSFIMSMLFMMNFKFIFYNFLFSIMLKLGVPPFHLWMPIISYFMSWNLLFFLLTVQKIIPLYMISLINMTNNMLIFYYMIFSSMLISTIKMINMLNFKILLTYSSINQTSWMLMLILFKNMFWLIYLMIYSLILFYLSLLSWYYKLSFNFNLNNYMNFKMMFLFMMFNMASIPPFSFFLMKWSIIFIFILNSSFYIILIFMLINSFILIYIYLNMMILMMFNFNFKLKINMNFNKLNLNKMMKNFMFMIMTLLISMMIITY